MRGRKYKYYE
jgi:hypothetical protein